MAGVPQIVSKKLFLMLKWNVNLLFTLAFDVSTLQLKKTTLLYNFSAPCADFRIDALVASSSNRNSFDSFSTIWSNLVWAERECLELSQICFKGLKDSRRLLLDYTTPKRVVTLVGPYSNFNEIFLDNIYADV